MIPSVRQVMARMPELEALSRLIEDPKFPTPEQVAEAAKALEAEPECPQGDLLAGR